MKQTRTKHHRDMRSEQGAALAALALLWVGCLGGEMLSHAPPQDASTDAAEPDASDSAVATNPCGPGTAGPHCNPCPAGSYCPGGTTPMALCGINAYDADQDPKTACVAASSCDAGTYVALLYSRVTDQRCARCPSGTFTAEANTRSCSVFRECGDTQYELLAPSELHDRQCAAWTQCQPGQHVKTQPTSTTDRECMDCAAGSFSAADNASQCQAWHACKPSELESATPSGSRDRSCQLRSECQPSDDDAGTVPSDCTTL